MIMLFGIVDLIYLFGNVFRSIFVPGFEKEDGAVTFNYIVSITSIICIMYVIRILVGIYTYREMKDHPERLHLVYFISHYRIKTLLYFVVTGISYFVLVNLAD